MCSLDPTGIPVGSSVIPMPVQILEITKLEIQAVLLGMSFIV